MFIIALKHLKECPVEMGLDLSRRMITRRQILTIRKYLNNTAVQKENALTHKTIHPLNSLKTG